MKTVTCNYCGREMNNDPGFYYHRKDCERRYYAAALEQLEKQGKADTIQYRRIKGLYELACYVGD